MIDARDNRSRRVGEKLTRWALLSFPSCMSSLVIWETTGSYRCFMCICDGSGRSGRPYLCPSTEGSKGFKPYATISSWPSATSLCDWPAAAPLAPSAEESGVWLDLVIEIGRESAFCSGNLGGIVVVLSANPRARVAVRGPRH